MAPEVLNGCDEKYPFKSDVWSFGCMILEVVSQKRPWHQFECDNVF